MPLCRGSVAWCGVQEIDEEIEVSEEIMQLYGWFFRPVKRAKDKRNVSRQKFELGPSPSLELRCCCGHPFDHRTYFLYVQIASAASPEVTSRAFYHAISSAYPKAR